jgi:hypothetical protein
VDPGRRAHYGAFYGMTHHQPVAIVWGNCQAESMRVLLAGSPSWPLPTVRVPPVHELVREDLTSLAALLPHVALLVTQPVRPGYRGLPIGTDEIVASLPPGARVVRWPVFRYVGLQPYAAIVRHPVDPAIDPPVVPYHDLRTLARAAGRPQGPPAGAAALRAVAHASLSELRRREGGTDVSVSDIVNSAGARAAHTLNHPGNPVLIALARRVQTFLGLPSDAEDPGRELLGGIQSPLEPGVVAALGLDVAPRPAWTVHGRIVEPGEIEDAQRRWYADNPGVVEGGMRRHADRIAVLGL